MFQPEEIVKNHQKQSTARSQDRYESVQLLPYLGDIVVKCVTEVFRLSDDEQVETPAATEVGHDDGVHGRRREELLPRRLQELFTKKPQKLVSSLGEKVLLTESLHVNVN